MKHRVFERMDVFSTKYGRESDMFLENGHFFTKYKHDSSDFFVKTGKKMVPYWHFWPIRWCNFHRIDVFFDQIWVWKQEVFHDKFEKKDMRALFFRELIFFDKIWTWERCVFREKTFCRQNMDITAVIFYEKSEKTDILLTYLAHNI